MPVEKPAGVESTIAQTESSTGLSSNVGGALSYLLGPITGILMYLIETKDEFVRFHAVQSTILFGGLFVVWITLSILVGVLGFIPIAGAVVALLLALVGILGSLLALVAWLFLMYKAFTGEMYAFPVVGGYARDFVSETE